MIPARWFPRPPSAAAPSRKTVAVDHARVAGRLALRRWRRGWHINLQQRTAQRVCVLSPMMDKVDQKAFSTRIPTSKTFMGRYVPDHRQTRRRRPRLLEMIEPEGVKGGLQDGPRSERQGRPISRFIKTIADIFVPILPPSLPAVS